MDIQKEMRKIRDRRKANDVVYTPEDLAKYLVGLTPIDPKDSLLDPCKGNGSFFKAFPEENHRDWCEIEEGNDFFEYKKSVDWCISNPPYSMLNIWLEQSCKISRKGFAYLRLVLHHSCPS